MDIIRIAYRVQLVEMAYGAGKFVPGENGAPDMDDPDFRKSISKIASGENFVKIFDNKEYETKTNGSLYATIHKNTGETHHVSVFGDHPQSIIPSIEQKATVKFKGSDLPKDHVINIMNHAMTSTDAPLASSGMQYEGGHKLWRKFIEKHVNEGLHHVYYHDGQNLNRTTKDNYASHLDSYYKPGDQEGYKTHMIVSPFPLTPTK